MPSFSFQHLSSPAIHVLFSFLTILSKKSSSELLHIFLEQFMECVKRTIRGSWVNRGWMQRQGFPKATACSCAATIHSNKHTLRRSIKQKDTYDRLNMWNMVQQNLSAPDSQNAQIHFGSHSSLTLVSVFPRLFVSLWERGWSLCPLSHTTPLPKDVCCCEHTPLHIPFKKTALLFRTSLLIVQSTLYCTGMKSHTIPLITGDIWGVGSGASK